MTSSERYLVELRAEGQGPPAAIRLRRWLKMALRGFGLRCVSVQEVPGPPPASAADRPAAGHLDGPTANVDQGED